MPEFTHIEDTRARMVDISSKEDLAREAVARGSIHLLRDTIRAISEGTVVKGNVLATARIAATLAVKGTPGLIPMCHQIPISSVLVDFSLSDDTVDVEVRVKSLGKTGVEMEALTGVAIALLTVWDMVKSAEKDGDGQYPHTRIMNIRVIEKRKSLP